MGNAAKSLSLRVNASRTGVRLGNNGIRRSEATGREGCSGTGQHTYEFVEFNRVETRNGGRRADSGRKSSLFR